MHAELADIRAPERKVGTAHAAQRSAQDSLEGGLGRRVPF